MRNDDRWLVGAVCVAVVALLGLYWLVGEVWRALVDSVSFEASLTWAVVATVSLPLAASVGYYAGRKTGEPAAYERGYTDARRKTAKVAAAEIEREYQRAEKAGDAYAKGVEKATSTVMGLAAKVAGVREQAAPKRQAVQPAAPQYMELPDFDVLELGDGGDILER